MNAIYFSDARLQMADAAALKFYGLEPDPFTAYRRPQHARTFGSQVRRANFGSEVLALVRQYVHVGEDDRQLIYRLVDSACQLLEDGEVLKPAVDRQDVKPAPLQDPGNRPNLPGSSAPTTTNPIRTIRSSRWTASRKAVRS